MSPPAWIFISYAREDAWWRDCVFIALDPLVPKRVWHDRRIKAGENWDEEIKRAIAESKVAVLIVSPAFAASTFIAQNEIRVFKERNHHMMPLLVEAVDLSLVPLPPTLQYHNALDQPVAGLTQPQAIASIRAFARAVKAAMDGAIDDMIRRQAAGGSGFSATADSVRHYNPELGRAVAALCAALIGLFTIAASMWGLPGPGALPLIVAGGVLSIGVAGALVARDSLYRVGQRPMPKGGRIG